MPKAAPPATKPYGRDQAKAELLAAARTLFSERGYDAVGVRDISKLANVNHALIHRHFGTKENLLQEVMKEDAAKFIELLRGVEDPAEAMHRLFEMTLADTSFARILAYSLLGNVNPNLLVVADGTLRRIAESVASSTASPNAASTRAKKSQASAATTSNAKDTTAIATALLLGWLLFEPFLATATDIEQARIPEVRLRVETLIGELVRNSVGAAHS